MKYYYLIVILFAVSANTNAFQIKTEIYEQFDDLRMAAFIDNEDIESSPSWRPGTSPLPLTVDDAIQAVADFREDSSTPENVREIEIRQLPRHEMRWHYLIKISNDRMQSNYIIYVVLMNGKVIPAIIEPTK